MIGGIHYAFNGKEVKISGQADTIKNFLEFREQLSNLPYVSQVISPPGNLVNFKDLKFDLRLKIK
ncbi:MAG: hypothetical protein HYW88_01225 [Candidatus Sungbacteria bacterium]|nr:hypothetical protein [Candidatus Sungbacteria bacterium]